MTPRCLCCGEALAAGERHYHARCAKRLFGSASVPALDCDQDALNALARDTVLNHVSVPGVQPKLSLHLERGAPGSRSRLTLVGAGGDYILKPQSPQWPNLPEAEHFCMLLARKCRIATAEFGLVPLRDGALAYVSRRMDRQDGRKLHMEDFCQILGKMTSQKYNGSMEQVGKALRLHSDAAGLDAVRYLELAVYCFLTGNSDMHLKNFSLLRHADGRLELSPAYDLLPVKVILPADMEELALTLSGKKSRLRLADFERFGQTLKLTDAQVAKALRRIVGAVAENLELALAASFMPEAMKTAVGALVAERLARLRGERDLPADA